MKLKEYRKRINNYFSKISAEEIVTRFEEVGYQFEDTISTDLSYATVCLEDLKRRLLDYFSKLTVEEFEELGYHFIEENVDSL
jgi:hypothetical protein